jgi:Icc-related predicted phosphoesterase
MPRQRRSRRGATRIFFAADLHGSDVTFRKFLRATSFYDVDVLVFAAT